MSDRLESAKEMVDALMFYNEILPKDEEVLHWLVEQAERVQGLENKIYLMKEVATQNHFEYQERLCEIDNLEQQNARYREEFKSLLGHATELREKGIHMDSTAVKIIIEKILEESYA